MKAFTYKLKSGRNFNVMLEVDSHKIIMALLTRAVRNKNSKATALGGGVVVEVQEIKKEGK